ncbi:ABC transporter ATP-binding protein [Desulfurobacterium sp.]
MGLVIDRIVKCFNGKKVLDEISLYIESGEFHVLLGPSGEGKSTLLRIVAGLEKCDGGKVYIDGREVTYMPPEKRHIGFLFQDFALFPHLTVYENVAFGLRIRGIDEAVIKDRVFRYLSMVDLSSYANVFPNTLSGGQKQRVALARTLVLNPSVLLLDEPLSHLDPMQRELLVEEFLKIHEKEGITILYVTHDIEEAEQVADKVSVIHNGRVEQTGSPDEIFYTPRTSFVASFVGATNIFSGSVRVNRENINFEVCEGNFRATFKVKYYPIFSRKDDLSLCVHPDKVFVGEKRDFNTLKGRILKISKRRGIYRLFVDVYGKIVVANVAEGKFKKNEMVSLFLPPEAFHPLCGKRERSPESERECLRNAL